MLDRAAIALLEPGLQRLARVLVRAGIGADAVTLFGFALGTVGVDLDTGQTRFTFGSAEMIGGIDFIGGHWSCPKISLGLVAAKDGSDCQCFDTLWLARHFSA